MGLRGAAVTASLYRQARSQSSKEGSLVEMRRMTRVVRWLTLTVSMLTFLAAGSSPVSAGGTLDQSQESQTDLNGVALVGAQMAAQTFTAGLLGGLDQVDLLLTRYGTPGDLIVEIRGVVSGIPTSQVLASGTISETALDADPYTYQWASAVLSPPSPVDSGSQYAIVAIDGGGANFPSDFFNWATTDFDAYINGMALTTVDGGLTWYPSPLADTAFRTYVAAVPTTKDDCKDGGWASFGMFKNQGDCVVYVIGE
jgi:hypothetical protein